MSKDEFYSGRKLMSMKDINGNNPEIIMVTTNRSGGKTTFFNRWAVKRFLRYNEKFLLLYRFTYELSDVANKFFKDIGGLFFPGSVMTSKSMSKGVYHELFIDNKPCGYATAINMADNVKKLSHLFSDVQRILFDEFQSETGKYCSKEVDKFQSIHLSVARGQGQFSRYVPVYMMSNPVTILNPYYMALGISARISYKDKFMRGEGWVLEQGFVDAASRSQKESAFNRAFQGSEMQAYANEAVYLNDSRNFIEKLSGENDYYLTIKYRGKYYAMRRFLKLGIAYIDDNPDMTYHTKIVTTTEDHEPNWIMLDRYCDLIKLLKRWFSLGVMRFKNLECKEAFLSLLRVK